MVAHQVPDDRRDRAAGPDPAEGTVLKLREEHGPSARGSLYRWGTAKRREADAEPPPRGAGWTVLSYLLSGIAAYGGIGWLVGRATHATFLFPVGMLAGLGISVGFVIYRYGRSMIHTDVAHPGGSPVKGADR